MQVRLRETTDDRAETQVRGPETPADLVGTVGHGFGTGRTRVGTSRHGSVGADALNDLRVTQLKRALRGAAFARGALYSLRGAATAEQLDELRRTLRQMEQDVFAEIGRLRSAYGAGGS